MLLFTRSRFPLSSVVVAAGLIAAATALAADPVDVASLAEYIATICWAAFLSYSVTKTYKTLLKKDLCRTDPYLAIKLTKICSRLPKSETLREQTGDLVRYRRLMQKFN
jgi:hypothetical protein